MYYIMIVVAGLGISGTILDVEALKCFNCTVTVTTDGVNGEPSCEMGKTPNDTFLQDCPTDLNDPVCVRMFSNQTAPTAYTLTQRLCGVRASLTLECRTIEFDLPAKGYSTTCFCDTDKCDPNDTGDSSTPETTEKSSAVSNMINFGINAMITLTILLQL